MTRIIRNAGPRVECVEGGLCLFHVGAFYTFRNVIKDDVGRVRIRRSGGLWNCAVFEFISEDPYRTTPAEPDLKWRFGVPGIFPARIESDGFSGTIKRTKTDTGRVFSLGSQTWTFDDARQELGFTSPHASVELRATLLAFHFFGACIPD